MRLRFLLIPVFALFAASAYARDSFLPIVGSVGTFRTDVRIVNPSQQEIRLNAYFFPAGNTNNGQAFAKPAVIIVPGRNQAVLNDVVASLFSATGIGAIYLSCSDPYLASARIYAQTPSGTLGQGYASGDMGSDLLTRGILPQLRSDASFRTNVGIANLQNSFATVTLTLYDRNSNVAGTQTMTLQPYAVIPPTSLSAMFAAAGNADLSDAWVSFTSDSPIGAYASVIDNSTTDPTYFAARPDPLP
jgi:hypothetical protein